MAKFRRVSEQGSSDDMVRAAGGNDSPNPYEKLKKTSGERMQRIAKDSTDYRLTKSDEPQEWSVVQSQSEYADYSYPKTEAEIQDSAFGALDGTVRRISAGAGPVDATRHTDNLELFSDEDYMNAMLRGSASIWSPDFADVMQGFSESQDTKSEILDQQAQRDIARETEHTRWQSDAVQKLQKSKYSTSRANPLLRTGSSVPHDGGKFNSINWNAIDGREKDRLQIREEKRNRTAQIKAVGRGREETHQSWEDNVDLNPGTVTDYYTQHGIDLDIE